MSQVKIRHPIQLIKYLVFNTTWGTKEGSEHEKLIYYYVKPTLVVGIDQKISDVGLAEAVINFGRQFGQVTKSLQGDRLRFIFHELAPNFWSSMFISESLLNGPIEELCDKLSRQEFLDKCHDFFDNYVPHIEILPFNLIELYSSIQYLPLSNTTFMAVQSLLNCVQANDWRIDSYIFIYNDQLVSSSLSLFDTQILYNYLTNIVIPDAVKEEISGISNKTRWLQVDFRIYLMGHPGHGSAFRNLCLFRSINGSTIGLILTEFDENILKECGTLLSSRLVSLTNKLHETVTQIAKQPDSKLTNDSSAKDIKFIYFNYSNCAQRGNSNCRKLIDSDFTRLIIDVESDLQQRFTEEQVFELIGKNMNDAWLVARNSDSRALFAMLNYKNANVIEASEMIDAMQNKHFKNLFFGI
ncbi:vacuolar fusion protein ccz1 [Dermatophagoides farinae]|uniref:Vacuolar fusion protein ccz1 n=1 Tax=Dermatophagoides farinae TaxID=6954 RepID=A0A9D4SG60_DERFA|nr:vacuolar fusion protein ccz1 [Dermatophagoides farinae]